MASAKHSWMFRPLAAATLLNWHHACSSTFIDVCLSDVFIEICFFCGSVALEVRIQKIIFLIRKIIKKKKLANLK